MAGRRPRAPQSGMKREHRPLAEADQSQLAVVEAVTIEFGIKKGVENRSRLVDPGPAFARVAHGQTEPLAPAWDLAAGLRRVGRDKGRVGHQIPPLLADRDQIIAVGAIAVQKYDELFWPPPILPGGVVHRALPPYSVSAGFGFAVSRSPGVGCDTITLEMSLARPGSVRPGAIRHDPVLYQPRFPFRAVLQRLSSPWPCLFRLAEFRLGTRERAAAFCCGSRISTSSAAGSNSNRRFTRISAGSGSRGKLPVRRQSEHFSEYANALDKLSAQGLTYPCFCSRGDIMDAVAGRTGWPRDPDGSPLYPGTCKHLSGEEKQRRISAGQPAALRIDMETAIAKAGRKLAWREMGPTTHAREVAAEPALWGDATLSRKDIPASYHIAVVVDDALQGVTDVVRGEDLFLATSLHRLLQVLLDLPAPAYRHHALLRDASGQKLSKSSRAKSLRALRQEGVSPAAVKERLAADPILAGGSC